ncbi:hypothetical protein WR25_19946 [Diploscapter pachys]|uniref:Uncharacterized protein n=1 Tax=Diploscapter pachys TaxID=2018661 RepID=A0A2A2L253_9BILA|nr:hypothetical protein WR25_19946 [Diploscapter pachys]
MGLVSWLGLFFQFLMSRMVMGDMCTHCTCDLNSHSVTCNSPSLLVRTVSLLPYVEELNLQNLRMPQPPHFLFNTHLRALRINHCGLSELSAHSLLPLPNLEVLNLANNNLATLPTTVLRSLKRLRIVNLSNNKITDLSKLSWVLAEGMVLEQLDLSGNPLALSNRFALLPPVHQLLMANANLQKINSTSLLLLPSTSCPADESCRVLMFDEKDLKLLHKVDISHNPKLIVEKTALEALTNAPYLDFSGVSLPSSFGNWLETQSRVVHLNVSSATIPLDGVWELCSEKLNLLDISSLRLHSIDLKKGCPLKILFAEDNLLNSIKIEANELETLHLERNMFTEFPSVPPGISLESLHTMSISNNLLTTLHPNALQHMPELQHLDLSKNQISEIDPQAFPSLGMQLISLDLSSNQLSSLPHPVLPSLLFLDASSNNLVNIDPVLFSGLPLLQHLRYKIGYLGPITIVQPLTLLTMRSQGLEVLVESTRRADIVDRLRRLSVPPGIPTSTIPFEIAKVGGAMAVGEQPIKGLVDAQAGARMTVAETLTNLVFARISNIKDVKMSGNWMWAAKAEGEGAKMVDAVDSLCQALKEVGVAIDGGKDSLSMVVSAGNELVKAPGTLVLTAYVTCSDIRKVVTPDLKASRDSSQQLPKLLYVRMGSDPKKDHRLGGSAFAQCHKQIGNDVPDIHDFDQFVETFVVIQRLIEEGNILAGHDVSDGGLITAILEMAFAGNMGLEIDLRFDTTTIPLLSYLFAEEAGVVLEVESDHVQEIVEQFSKINNPADIIGTVHKVHGPDANIKLVANGQEIFNETLVRMREIWEETGDRLGEFQTDEGCLKQAKEIRQTTKLINYAMSVELPVPRHHLVTEIAPKVAILREEGSNGDREMAAVFRMAGFNVFDVTMTDLLGGLRLDQFRGIAFVGGFSYADVLGSAKGWAAAVLYNEKIRHEFDRFRTRSDTFSFGVCNGCQLMTLLGWVGTYKNQPSVFLDENKCGRFESYFGPVKIRKSKSLMLQGMENSILGLWSSHGEGRFTYRNGKVLAHLLENEMVCVQYCDGDGEITEKYPLNPNGSELGVAAICSEDGRHLAMMPHSDRSFLSWQWPDYPDSWKTPGNPASPWLRMFTNAYDWTTQNS